MPDYTFQWTDEKGQAYRKVISTLDYSYAWFKALQSCGLNNRTSLGLVGDDKNRQIKNGIIINWFEVTKQMHYDENLKKFKLAMSWSLNDRLNSGFFKVISV
jgi:hypothetical protein